MDNRYLTDSQATEYVEKKKQEFFNFISQHLPPQLYQKVCSLTENILSYVSLPAKVFIVDAIFDFFLYVYDFPASLPEEEFLGSHHTEEFGLFIHSLEVSEKMLRLSQNRTLIEPNPEGYFLSATGYITKPAQEYLIFLAGIFHDIGKMVSYEAHDRDDRRNIYKPFLETYFKFRQRTKNVVFKRNETSHSNLNLVGIFGFMTKSDLEFITEPRPTQGYWAKGLEVFCDIFSDEPQTFLGKEIAKMLIQADKRSIVEYKEEKEGELSKIRSCLILTLQYHQNKKCWKFENFTAFLFPFIFREIAEKVYNKTYSFGEQIPEALTERIFSLLEDHLIVEEGKKIRMLKSKNEKPIHCILVKNEFLEPEINQYEVNNKWVLVPITEEKEVEKEQEEQEPQKQKEDEYWEYFLSLSLVDTFQTTPDYLLEAKNFEKIWNNMKVKFPDITAEDVKLLIEKFIKWKKQSTNEEKSVS
jgi:hypothetical protein